MHTPHSETRAREHLPARQRITAYYDWQSNNHQIFLRNHMQHHLAHVSNVGLLNQHPGVLALNLPYHCINNICLALISILPSKTDTLKHAQQKPHGCVDSVRVLFPNPGQVHVHPFTHTRYMPLMVVELRTQPCAGRHGCVLIEQTVQEGLPETQSSIAHTLSCSDYRPRIILATNHLCLAAGQSGN